MAELDMGLKELEKVKIKATYNMDIGNLHFNEGEVITEFDSIQLANFSEIRSYITAHGGYEDRTRVVWDTVKEIKFYFTRGIFNKLQFAMFQNAKIIVPEVGEGMLLTEVEHLESDESGKIQLKYAPAACCVVRDKEGQRIEHTIGEDNEILIEEPYKDVIVSYDFNYNGNTNQYIFGQRFLNGYVALEARTRVKDDITGQTHTGIIKIPKLKLASDLSMRLGDQANPLLGNFHAIGYPIGSKGSTKVMELILLDDDIDSDIS